MTTTVPLPVLSPSPAHSEWWSQETEPGGSNGDCNLQLSVTRSRGRTLPEVPGPGAQWEYHEVGPELHLLKGSKNDIVRVRVRDWLSTASLVHRGSNPTSTTVDVPTMW